MFPATAFAPSFLIMTSGLPEANVPDVDSSSVAPFRMIAPATLTRLSLVPVDRRSGRSPACARLQVATTR